MRDRYRIVRMYFKGGRRVINTGLTLGAVDIQRRRAAKETK